MAFWVTALRLSTLLLLSIMQNLHARGMVNIYARGEWRNLGNKKLPGKAGMGLFSQYWRGNMKYKYKKQGNWGGMQNLLFDMRGGDAKCLFKNTWIWKSSIPLGVYIDWSLKYQCPTIVYKYWHHVQYGGETKYRFYYLQMAVFTKYNYVKFSQKIP